MDEQANYLFRYAKPSCGGDNMHEMTRKATISVSACATAPLTGDKLDETVAVDSGAIAELAIIVVTRGPHTTIVFKHHAVVIPGSHNLHTT